MSPGVPRRDPLRGGPERLLEGLRAAGAWLQVAAAFVTPLPILTAAAPWFQAWIPSGGLRLALFPVLYLGLAVAVGALFGALLKRMYLGRDVGLGEDGLTLGSARVWGRASFRLVREEEVPGLPVPWEGVREVFRVPMGVVGGEDLVAVGLWFVDGEGRGREAWLPLAPEAAGELLEAVEAATGRAPRAPGEETSPAPDP